MCEPSGADEERDDGGAAQTVSGAAPSQGPIKATGCHAIALGPRAGQLGERLAQGVAIMHLGHDPGGGLGVMREMSLHVEPSHGIELPVDEGGEIGIGNRIDHRCRFHSVLACVVGR